MKLVTLFLIPFCTLLSVTAAHAQDRPRKDVVEIPAIDAGLWVSNTFQSNMVIQRDKPIHLWGWADPGETVTLENILVGDVWILSGQSNMEFDLAKLENGKLEIVGAHYPKTSSLPTKQQTSKNSESRDTKWTNNAGSPKLAKSSRNWSNNNPPLRNTTNPASQPLTHKP